MSYKDILYPVVVAALVTTTLLNIMIHPAGVTVFKKARDGYMDTIKIKSTCKNGEIVFYTDRFGEFQENLSGNQPCSKKEL